VSPFIGRLDDIGRKGVDLVSNITRMYESGDGHVLVLAASIRSIAHLLYCFSVGADLVTVPATVLRQWADGGFQMPDARFTYPGVGSPIAYEPLDLEQPWRNFRSDHELTTKGIEKFVADYRETLYSHAP
jgi:transaldolase